MSFVLIDVAKIRWFLASFQTFFFFFSSKLWTKGTSLDKTRKKAPIPVQKTPRKDKILQKEDALGTHVEEQVEDGEVGQEAVTLLPHLIIGPWCEVGVG